MKTLPLTARSPRPYTPPALEKRYYAALDAYDKAMSTGLTADQLANLGPKPTLPIFELAVATHLERDTIGSLLFELGVVQVTPQTVRNTMLEAMFDHYDEEQAEEKAIFLETFWQNQDITDQLLLIWQEQERQRVLDEAAGGDAREPYPMPEQMTTLRDRLRAKRECDEIIRLSTKVRRTIGQQTDYTRQNSTMLIRLHARGWSGLRTQREALGGPPADLLTEDCTDQLREELGAEAWSELWHEIDRQYGLSVEEVGNSVSPPDSGSKPDGSAGTGGDAPISDGNSHGDLMQTGEERSNSEPILPAASDQIIEQS